MAALGQWELPITAAPWSSLGVTIATDPLIGWEKSTATEQTSRLRSAANAADRCRARTSPLGAFLLVYYDHYILALDGCAAKLGQEVAG
jgi:hypothetical protein